MTSGKIIYDEKEIKFEELIEGKVIQWGNSAGIYIPKKYLNKKVVVAILKDKEKERGQNVKAG